MTQARKHWIDLLRGIWMLAILLDHTEIYYTGINIIDYNAYVVNALTIFFMLSGYLMYKETGFDIRKKMKSIAQTLLLPYFIFFCPHLASQEPGTWQRNQHHEYLRANHSWEGFLVHSSPLPIRSNLYRNNMDS